MNELLTEALKEERKLKRRNRIISILAIVFISVLLIIYSLIQARNEAIKAENAWLQAEQLRLDALEAQRIAIEEREIAIRAREEAKIENYKVLVIMYFAAANAKDNDALMKMLADTLSRFYLEEYIPKEQVRIHMNKHTQRIPSDSIFIAEGPNIVVNREEVLSYTTVKYKRSPVSKPKEYVAEIRFDPDSDEIYFIRMYERSFMYK